MNLANSIDIPMVLSSEEIDLPTYSRLGDGAMDIRSSADVTLSPFQRALIPTGISAAIPAGYVGLILPRSGLALTEGLSLVNSPGLIDSNYRGEIQIIAINLDLHTDIEIKAGDRVAQLLVCPYTAGQPIKVEKLDTTIRGDRGFGSSGTQ